MTGTLAGALFQFKKLKADKYNFYLQQTGRDCPIKDKSLLVLNGLVGEKD